MKETIIKLIKQVIGEEVEFEINEETNDSQFHNYTVMISEEYKAKLIGKRGRAITSIFNLANIQAKKENIRINIKIQD
jgi:predicted RNA-binding protein YlqC (UPF0109 family)